MLYVELGCVTEGLIVIVIGLCVCEVNTSFLLLCVQWPSKPFKRIYSCSVLGANMNLPNYAAMSFENNVRSVCRKFDS